MVAPVLPAPTMAAAAPSRTNSAARTTEASLRVRTARPGSSSMPMASVATTKGSPDASTTRAAPTNTTGAPCAAAVLAPATTAAGA